MVVFDVIIVGAGPAGCAAAYDLGAAGKKVLLLDKENFPRKKSCAGMIPASVVKNLRYSVAPVLHRKVSRSRITLNDETSEYISETIFLASRAEFDHYCLMQTLQQGVLFKRIEGIAEIDLSCGVLIHTEEGEALRANVVIGCDGAVSAVRKILRPEVRPAYAFALEAEVPHCPHIPKEEIYFDFTAVKNSYGWICSKKDHINAGIYCRDRRHIKKADLIRFIRKYGLEEPPEISGALINIGNKTTPIAADDVLLAGDAAGFTDALTGGGIHEAVISGKCAAQAVLESQCIKPFQRYRELIRPLQLRIENKKKCADFLYARIPSEQSFAELLHRIPLSAIGGTPVEL